MLKNVLTNIKKNKEFKTQNKYISRTCYSVLCAGRFVTMLASVILTVILFFFKKKFHLEKHLVH